MLRLVALAAGACFGLILAWAQLNDPIVVQRMLLLQEPDVFLLMGSAMAVAFVGVRALRGAKARSFVGNEVIAWSPTRPTRDHVIGSIAFGIGWSIASTCPGPLAVQLGAGQLAAVFTLVGVFVGIGVRGWQMQRRANVHEVMPVVVAGL